MLSDSGASGCETAEVESTCLKIAWKLHARTLFTFREDITAAARRKNANKHQGRVSDVAQTVFRSLTSSLLVSAVKPVYG